MMRFKVYPSYNDSGVEWLGDIPTHWESLALKRVVDPARPVTYGIVQCGPDFPDGVPYIRPVDMEDEKGVKLEALQRTAPEIAKSYARSTVRPCDVVVSIGPSFGKAMVVPPELDGANLTQGTARVAPGPRVTPRFLFWALRGGSSRQAWDSYCSGATFRALTLRILETCAIALPPSDEQRAIAAFLDRETAKIDALVAKRERLVELLEEKRATVIAETVTRGPNCDVQTSQSGVATIGPIPNHWETKRLMHLTDDRRPIMYGIVLPGPNVDDGVPIVKGGDITPGRLRLDALDRTTREIEAGYVRSRLREGDIVYAIRGSIGMAEIVPAEFEGANLTQDAARVAPKAGIDYQWLLFALKSRPVFAQLDAGATGATIRGINIRDLKRAVLPFPPPQEQKSIANFLQQRVRDIDFLVAKVREAVERLKEYRTALISAAVTGKIDVRGNVSV